MYCLLQTCDLSQLLAAVRCILHTIYVPYILYCSAVLIGNPDENYNSLIKYVI